MYNAVYFNNLAVKMLIEGKQQTDTVSRLSASRTRNSVERTTEREGCVRISGITILSVLALGRDHGPRIVLHPWRNKTRLLILTRRKSLRLLDTVSCRLPSRSLSTLCFFFLPFSSTKVARLRLSVLSGLFATKGCYVSGFQYLKEVI